MCMVVWEEGLTRSSGAPRTTATHPHHHRLSHTSQYLVKQFFFYFHYTNDIAFAVYLDGFYENCENRIRVSHKIYRFIYISLAMVFVSGDGIEYPQL